MSMTAEQLEVMVAEVMGMYPELATMNWTTVPGTNYSYPISTPWWSFDEFVSWIYFVHPIGVQKHKLGGPGQSFIPLILGVMIDGLLLGVLWGQAYWWWNNSRHNERPIIKSAVIGLVVFSTAVWLVAVVWVCYLFGFNYGKYVPFTEHRWYTSFPFLNSIIVCIVQLFYAERAYKMMGKKKIVLGLVLIPLMVACVGGTGVLIFSNITNLISGPIYIDFMWCWIAGMLASDVVVTAIVLWTLFKNRSEFQQTDNLVLRLIRISCESQLPPTLLSLAFLITYAVIGVNFFLIFFGILEPQFYSIGMLYVLNSRTLIRRDINNPSHSNSRGGGGGMAYTLKKQTGSRTQDGGGPSGIHVQTDTYVEMHHFQPHHVNNVLKPKIRDEYGVKQIDEEASYDRSDDEDATVNISEVGLTQPSAYGDKPYSGAF